MLVSGQVSLSLADPEGIKPDYGGEVKDFVAQIRTSELVCMVIYSESPRHYTYLELRKDAAKGWIVTYKDSLRFPSEKAKETAKLILINLGLEDFIHQVVPSNSQFQAGGWECGLFVLRWIEAAMRKFRGVTCKYMREKT